MNREFGFFFLRAANTNCLWFAIKKLLQIVARVFRFDLSTVHQLGKRGIGIFQQFGWRVEFDQLAAAHHHHPVRIHYGFQPMGDGQHGRLTKCRSDCFLNQTVRLCIDTGRRFVNTNHLEIFVEQIQFYFQFENVANDDSFLPANWVIKLEPDTTIVSGRRRIFCLVLERRSTNRSPIWRWSRLNGNAAAIATIACPSSGQLGPGFRGWSRWRQTDPVEWWPAAI